MEGASGLGTLVWQEPSAGRAEAACLGLGNRPGVPGFTAPTSLGVSVRKWWSFSGRFQVIHWWLQTQRVCDDSHYFLFYL